MRAVRVLLVSPKRAHFKHVVKAMGDPTKGTTHNVSGLGTVTTYPSCGVGFITMLTGGDRKQRCKRIEVAWKKYPQIKRIGVILPEFTEAWMRANGFAVRYNMYLLNDIIALRDFIGASIRDESKLSPIFTVVPKKTKKRKVPAATAPPLAIKERKVDIEPATTEETTCIVCMTNKITHMCVPCTHFLLCGVCAAKVKLDGCPSCRKPITSFITPHTK